MKKNVFGRQFKRDTNERKALFKNLLTSLVMHERIRTTEAKAKAIKSEADKLVTKAKKGGNNAYRNLEPNINHDAVVKMIEDIAPRFAGRPGGYTRIIKIGKRRVADNAEMVLMEWTETKKVLVETEAKKGAKKADKKAAPKKEKKEAKVAVAKKPEAKASVKSVAKKLVTRQKKG